MIAPSRFSLHKQAAAGKPEEPTGGFFHVRAVSRGEGGLWTFISGGKTLTAKTAASLQPGAFYAGVFVRKNGVFEFFPRAPFSGGSGGAPLVSRLPLPGSADFSRYTLARAFFQAGLSLPQGPAYEELLKFVTAKNKRETLSRAALAARCGEKGLSLPLPACESLHAVLEGSGGRGGGGRRGRHSGTDETEDAAPVRGVLLSEAEGGGGEGDLLRLFNHTALGDEAWTVYPYRCTADGEPYWGSLRVLYSRRGKTAKKQILFVRAAENDSWHFVWENTGNSLKIYYAGGLDRHKLLTDAWKRKFRKLGLYSDDIVYNGENFDGFSDDWEDSTGIDELA